MPSGPARGSDGRPGQGGEDRTIPIYSHDCEACGSFADMRPMSDASVPRPCPDCRQRERDQYMRKQADFPLLAGFVGAGSLETSHQSRAPGQWLSRGRGGKRPPDPLCDGTRPLVFRAQAAGRRGGRSAGVVIQPQDRIRFLFHRGGRSRHYRCQAWSCRHCWRCRPSSWGVFHPQSVTTRAVAPAIIE